MLTQSKETKPVKSIPKDFSDTHPVNRDNPSIETKPVKLIPKDFSEAHPVKRDKTN